MRNKKLEIERVRVIVPFLLLHTDVTDYTDLHGFLHADLWDYADLRRLI